MRLVLEGDTVKFEPDFIDFEVVLLNLYDVMVKAVMVVPRVETKLYSEWKSSKESRQFYKVQSTHNTFKEQGA